MQMVLSKFLNISSLFSNKTTKPQEEISRKATLFLNNDSLNIYYDMVRHGYTPTEEQDSLFNSKLKSIMRKESSVIQSLIEKHEYQFSPKEFLNFFYDIEDKHYFTYKLEHIKGHFMERVIPIVSLNQINTSNHDDSYADADDWVAEYYSDYNYNKIVYKHLNSLYELPEYQTAFLNEFIDLVKSTSNNPKVKEEPNTIFKLILAFHMIKPDTFKEINVEEYLSISAQIKILADKKPKLFKYEEGYKGTYRTESLVKVNSLLQKGLTEIYQEQISALVDETKTHYLSEAVTKKAKNSYKINIDAKFSTDNLPKIALEKIDVIESIYRDISKHIPGNSENPIIKDSNKMIESSLPEVIKGYITMKPEYRTSLLNSQGKHAEQLMLESLDSLIELLNTNLESLQLDNLTHLSVNNRVLKKKLGA